MHAHIAHNSGRGRSAIHRLDARWKIIAAVAFVILTIAVPRSWWPAYLLLGGIVLGIHVSARLSFAHLLRRLAVAMPFVIMVAAGAPLSQGFAGGFAFAGQIVVRALLALSIMIALSSTTPYEKLLAALERLKMPRILVWVLAFMHRYMFVLADELFRMRQAKAARTFRRNSWTELEVMGNFIGVLFVRAFERAERVYAAMCARGWTTHEHREQP